MSGALDAEDTAARERAGRAERGATAPPPSRYRRTLTWLHHHPAGTVTALGAIVAVVLVTTMLTLGEAPAPVLLAGGGVVAVAACAGAVSAWAVRREWFPFRAAPAEVERFRRVWRDVRRGAPPGVTEADRAVLLADAESVWRDMRRARWFGPVAVVTAAVFVAIRWQDGFAVAGSLLLALGVGALLTLLVRSVRLRRHITALRAARVEETTEPRR